MENPNKIDDLGVPLFSETPIFVGSPRLHLDFGLLSLLP